MITGREGDRSDAARDHAAHEVEARHPVPDARARTISEGDTMNYDSDTVEGYAVPVDPMDLLQCDSCQ